MIYEENQAAADAGEFGEVIMEAGNAADHVAAILFHHVIKIYCGVPLHRHHRSSLEPSQSC